jgi:hypothetical protein
MLSVGEGVGPTVGAPVVGLTLGLPVVGLREGDVVGLVEGAALGFNVIPQSAISNSRFVALSMTI